jgi:SdpC family antimicrobial peptide
MRNISRTVAAATTVASFGAAAYAAPLLSETQPTGAQTAEAYTDTEYLQALVFGEGRLADELALESAHPATADDVIYRELRDSYVTATLSAGGPELASAIDDLRSANPLTVEDGLDAVQAILERDRDKTAGVVLDGFDGERPGIAPQGAVVSPIVAAAAVVGVAVAAALYVVVYKGNWFWGGKSSTTGSGPMTRETLVAELAVRG